MPFWYLASLLHPSPGSRVSRWPESEIPRIRAVKVKESRSLSTKSSGHQNMVTSSIVRAPETEEMGQAAGHGFSNSMLSPGGMVAFLLIWVFLGLPCSGVAPCFRPSTGSSWGSKCCPSTLTGSVFVDTDQLGHSWDKRAFKAME